MFTKPIPTSKMQLNNTLEHYPLNPKRRKGKSPQFISNVTMQQQIYYSLITTLHMHHQSTKPIPLLIRLTHASSIYQSDPSPNIIVSGQNLSSCCYPRKESYLFQSPCTPKELHFLRLLNLTVKAKNKLTITSQPPPHAIRTLTA